MLKQLFLNESLIHSVKSTISDWFLCPVFSRRTIPLVQSLRNVRLCVVRTSSNLGVTIGKSCVSESPIEIDANINETKVIKVAIIGVPNAGKSTVINQLVGQKVCSASVKVHTTRFKVRAVANEGNTQIVLLDTPGLVGKQEVSKHHLEKSFIVDGHSASKEADIMCVIQDASNKWTRDKIDKRVMELLKEFQHKRSLLVLNKVDLLKSKRVLLDLVRTLASGKNENVNNWPHFEQIFMVSALTGSGIPELKDFLLDIAPPGPWLFEPNVCTDLPSEKLVEDAVKAALLDNLPEEIPYEIKPVLEHMYESPDGKIIAVVLLVCSLKRIERIVMGRKGCRVRKIAQAAEQQLASAFDTTVILNLVVTEQKQ